MTTCVILLFYQWNSCFSESSSSFWIVQKCGFPASLIHLAALPRNILILIFAVIQSLRYDPEFHFLLTCLHLVWDKQTITAKWEVNKIHSHSTYDLNQVKVMQNLCSHGHFLVGLSSHSGEDQTIYDHGNALSLFLRVWEREEDITCNKKRQLWNWQLCKLTALKSALFYRSPGWGDCPWGFNFHLCIFWGG